MKGTGLDCSQSLGTIKQEGTSSRGSVGDEKSNFMQKAGKLVGCRDRKQIWRASLTGNETSFHSKSAALWWAYGSLTAAGSRPGGQSSPSPLVTHIKTRKLTILAGANCYKLVPNINSTSPSFSSLAETHFLVKTALQKFLGPPGYFRSTNLITPEVSAIELNQVGLSWTNLSLSYLFAPVKKLS